MICHRTQPHRLLPSMSVAAAGLLALHGAIPAGWGQTVDGEQRARAALETLGAVVLPPSGPAREVVLNRNPKLTDADLASVSALSALTDLSLEETGVGDAGLTHLSGLKNLEWLNLYRTRVGDDGLAHLSRLPALALLPLGETQITDDGLKHLSRLTTLTYLGLKGNAITDRGVAHLKPLNKNLTGLHLGNTRVTDAAMAEVARFGRLETLWLHDTRVTDRGLKRLHGLKRLKSLYLQRSNATIGGVRALRKALPGCRVAYESDQLK